MRLQLTCHIAGDHAAQVLTPAVFEFADFVVLTTPYTLGLPLLRDTPAAARGEKVACVVHGPDFERLRDVGSAPASGFNVGYVGTVGFVKLHPRFVEMSAAVDVPEVRFLVAGGGDAVPVLVRRAAALGASPRFEWLGYVEDVARVLERMHVFGYPLRADTYATGEAVLQEAMYAGVPPVLFAHGAPASLVSHGDTGVIAHEEREYTEAIERLHGSPAERRRLGANAGAEARRRFGAENAAPQLGSVHERVMELPKRARAWRRQRLSPYGGADAFIESIGDAVPAFRRSLLAHDEVEAREAEREIAHASPVVTDAAGGGVLHYRRFHPRDPYLRLWAGLVLAAHGRSALAAAEFHGARELGLALPRLAEYLAEALERAK